MKKLEKKEFVEQLTKDLKETKAVVLVDTAKMDFKAQQALQKELKKVGAKMKIVKNTLFKIAGKNLSYPDSLIADETLAGQTAVVMAYEDPVAPIQTLGKFLKTSEVPQPKAGFVEGSYQDKNGIMAISKLPGKNELYAQVVGSIMSPAYGLVGALQGNLQKLVWILQTKSQS